MHGPMKIKQIIMLVGLLHIWHCVDDKCGRYVGWTCITAPFTSQTFNPISDSTDRT